MRPGGHYLDEATRRHVEKVRAAKLASGLGDEEAALAAYAPLLKALGKTVAMRMDGNEEQRWIIECQAKHRDLKPVLLTNEILEW